MSIPVIYANTQYVAAKHSFITVPQNVNLSLTSLTNVSTSNVMTIVSGNVGIGTTVPRQLLDIQGGNMIMSGNVGIGTTNPQEKIHVDGNILTTGTVYASNLSASNLIVFGKVGIGKTNPSTNLDAVNAQIANLDVFSTSYGQGYNNAAIEVREYNLVGSSPSDTSWNINPRIGFHWSARAAASISMDVNGTILFNNNPGTGYTGIVSQYLTTAADVNVGNTIYCGNWFRSTGQSGWYNNTYGGGWWMSDGTWIRSYGKSVYMDAISAGGIYCGSYHTGGYSFWSERATSAGPPLWVNGNCVVNQIWVQSDKRIKKEIIDIDEIESISIINRLKPRKYKYIDKYINKKEDLTYSGFIAQEVEPILQQAIDISTSFIPDIMYFTSNHTQNYIAYKPNDIVIGDRLKIYNTDKSFSLANDNNNTETSHEVKVINIDDNGIYIDKEFINKGIFIYGKEVKDFKTLKTDAIIPFLVKTCQTLLKKNEDLEKRLQIIESKI